MVYFGLVNRNYTGPKIFWPVQKWISKFGRDSTLKIDIFVYLYLLGPNVQKNMRDFDNDEKKKYKKKFQNENTFQIWEFFGHLDRVGANQTI